MSKATSAENSISERPISMEPRRLAAWINPTGAKKVHSLVDKVYKLKNLHMAWVKVKENNGSGGVDEQTIADFETDLEENLKRLHDELRTNVYKASPVKQHLIPKAGQPDKLRKLGIPTVYDRVCQQALKNRLEPIFEPVFDDANFGYRPGRSTKDALRKVWTEIQAGHEWIVDADLSDFFGTTDHEKVITLLNQQISDSSVLRLIRQMMKAGCMADSDFVPTETGVPQGGVISPLISNVLLTPFDKEMRRKGFNLTRYADDWIVTCKTYQEAQVALAFAGKILSKLGVQLHPIKTKIVHVSRGFEFLGFKIKRGKGKLRLPTEKLTSNTTAGMIYAYPKDQSIKGFMDKVRAKTRRKAGISTWQLVQDLNPLIRGWGLYYCKAHVRRLFVRLKVWIVHRIWSHRFKRWRNAGWKRLPERVIYENYGLVKLTALIPSLQRRKEAYL